MAAEDQKKPSMKGHIFHPAIVGVVAILIGIAIGYGIWGHKKKV